MNDTAFLLCPDFFFLNRPTDPLDFQVKTANKPFIFLGLTLVKSTTTIVCKLYFVEVFLDSSFPMYTIIYKSKVFMIQIQRM